MPTRHDFQRRPVSFIIIYFIVRPLEFSYIDTLSFYVSHFPDKAWLTCLSRYCLRARNFPSGELFHYWLLLRRHLLCYASTVPLSVRQDIFSAARFIIFSLFLFIIFFILRRDAAFFISFSLSSFCFINIFRHECPPEIQKDLPHLLSHHPPVSGHTSSLPPDR